MFAMSVCPAKAGVGAQAGSECGGNAAGRQGVGRRALFAACEKVVKCGKSAVSGYGAVVRGRKRLGGDKPVAPQVAPGASA